MRSRRGVSLVEVLVASALLAVGVSGALSALVTAARLRQRASVREAVTRRVEARLAWFTLQGCASVDTVVVDASAAIEERWRVTRSGAVARLDGRARSVDGGRPVRVALVHERRCP
ncbi:MAG: prepilin-type N-terminal cleavage/methylation domain-containing protein [Gemmatimonadetes bacterium]|nr:prepilin-type N-terminal cleavage/methylation domain-containing protein [Gemmatimonadota bacterium]